MTQAQKSGDALALAFARHAATTRFKDLPTSAVEKAKTFLLDTLGVAIAGSTGAALSQVESVASSWGQSNDARTWVGGARLPAVSAAIVNAYLIHCLEFDCVHEGAVVHPMATLLSALFAFVEREKNSGRSISGEELLTAICVGVDVAGLIGVATDAPVRFFRPATAGGFGATAAIANVARLDEQTTLSAFGNLYGQTSGTLQPHTEGSVLLGLQIGFNARAAIAAIDLARAGVQGPVMPLLGRYGYYALMEQESVDPERVFSRLGKEFQIERLSHKPYPSGRLTHGVVHGLRDLMKAHGFTAEDVVEVVATVPQLVSRLVGRPLIEEPQSNYAKLCLPFVAGVFLARGACDVPDFRGAALVDPIVHRHAAKVRVVTDANPNPNALDPQTIAVTLASGQKHSIIIPKTYGHPEAALTSAENEDKFRRCCANAAAPIPAARVERLLGLVRDAETMADCTALLDAMIGP